MSHTELAEWLQRDDSEFVDALLAELTRFIESLESEQLTGFAVNVLDGANYRGEYLSVSYTSDGANDNYTRFCADEWPDGSDDALANSGKLLLKRHATFAGMHSKAAGDYMMDNDQIANLAHLEHSVLAAMKGVRDKLPTTAFQAVWNPHGPTDITPESVRALNSETTCEAFLAEFGDNWPDFE